MEALPLTAGEADHGIHLRVAAKLGRKGSDIQGSPYPCLMALGSKKHTRTSLFLHTLELSCIPGSPPTMSVTEARAPFKGTGLGVMAPRISGQVTHCKPQPLSHVLMCSLEADVLLRS